MTKHIFAGGSTPKGFIDFFEHIMPLGIAEKRYFLKGSSGSGKSTFIKKIAARLEAGGIEIEKFHCANDIESLDAISAKNLGLCIIDATAPHSHDPDIPIAIDRIIDFAEFIDEGKIRKSLDEIKLLLNAKKILNEKASCYLGAVGNIYLAEYKVYEAAIKRISLNRLIQKWVKLLDSCKRADNCFGTNRKLFLSAITPDGFTGFANNYFSDIKVYGLLGETCAGIDAFLTGIRDEANAREINTESFYCPFAPERLEHLHLPGIKAAFATMGSPFGYKGDVEEIIDMNIIFNEIILKDIKQDVSKNKENKLFDMTLNAAIDTMRASRDLHGKIEEIYINAMDFERLNKASEKITEEILFGCKIK